MQQRLQNDRRIVRTLDEIIQHEREANRKMSETQYSVEEKQVDPILVAAIRMVGRYSECGSAFGQIGRRFGRVLCGKPMLLHHDNEYKEQADFEAAMPIKRGTSVEGITVRELPGGRCVSLMHLGPYDDLGRSYETIIKHCKANGLQYQIPTREIYHKGPGMIFRGNPIKYLTEIQMMIE